jgi:DNA-binding transcriptional MerR regulator
MATYTIAELAREFDITLRAIRFYEDQGLISPLREGTARTRVYSARERTRLKLTLRGKRLGLTLSEIKSVVDMYESPKDTAAQMERLLQVLAQHRERMERQREDIEGALAEIIAQEEECKHLLAQHRIPHKARNPMSDKNEIPEPGLAVALRHAEYKIPEGKLVVVDLAVANGRLQQVQLSGDFFLEPPEALEAINAALDGLPADTDAEQLAAAVRAALGPQVMMYGLTPEGIAVVVQRALA